MNEQQLAAVRSCTPNFDTWTIASRRQLANRIRTSHIVGARALIRTCAIVRDRYGRVTELRRGEPTPPAATIGTRTYYLNPDNTVDHTDEWI